MLCPEATASSCGPCTAPPEGAGGVREENPRVTSGGRIAPAARLGACADPPSPPGELCSSSQCCRNQHTELAPSLVQEPPRPCSAAPSLPPLGLQGGRVPDPEPAGSLLPSAAPCLPPLRSFQGKLCPRLGPRVSRAAPLLCQAPPSCCPSVVLTVLIYSTSPHLRRSPNAFAATPPGFIPPRGPEGRRWRGASGGGGGHGARGAPGSSTPESRAGEAGGARRRWAAPPGHGGLPGEHAWSGKSTSTLQFAAQPLLTTVF